MNKRPKSFEPYTLGSVRSQLEDIADRLDKIERQFSSELYTVSNSKEAEMLFLKLMDRIKQGQCIELIIRKV